MAAISLPSSTLTRTRDVFLLYSKKSAFNIEEYADTGAVYGRLVVALEGAQKSGSADVSETDVKFVITAINICSQRVPTEVQNYRPIAELLDTLAATVKTEEKKAEPVETVEEDP